jgi:hypothetical protein
MPLRPPFALALLAFMVMLAGVADSAAPKKDPPGTETIMANLRAWFAKYCNDNKEIGKVEAAKAFGYSRPYDVGPVLKTPTGKPKEDDKDKDKDSKDTGTSGTAPKKSDKPDKSTYANRPDFLFIAGLDKDGDEKVSKEEFEAWAHDYAVQLALSEQASPNQKQTKAQQAASKNFQQQQKQFGNLITGGGKK